jgi:hypothetical protein
MNALRVYQLVRIVSGLILAGTAAWHVTRALAGDGSVLRHWLFVAINAALAALLVWRPRWAFYPTIALTVQQLASHGLDLSNSFAGTASLDKVSLAVCLFFPTLATILYLEREERASLG